MGKKHLIVLVTFLAGLYYFLEFIVPATVPWKTVNGRVVSATAKSVTLDVSQSRHMKPGRPDDTGIPKRKTVSINGNIIVFRERPTGAPERVDPVVLKPGDSATIGPTTYLSGWITNVNNFFVVLGAMAWGMGLLSLWMVHSSNIRRRRKEWYGSVLFFIGVGGGVFAGLGYGQQGGWLKGVNDIVIDCVLLPVSSTVFSLLAFYMVSAAYRSFRVSSKEALLMMASAFIVMLGQIPLGLWLTHRLPEFMWLPVVSQWILYVANSAAVRGMWFGMMLGAIAVGLRFWLSLERGAFFDREL